MLATLPGLNGPQAYIVILCRFADMPDVTPQNKGWVQTLMGSAFPGMDHYWREASYGAMDLSGSVVVGWYELPQPKSYYTSPQVALEGCTAVADDDIYFPDFDGILLYFNDQMLFPGQAGGMFLQRDGQNKAYKVIWLGLDGVGESAHSTLAHELGHTFGLPHTTGVGIMNGWFGSIDPEYGQIAVHPNAYHKDLLGWIPGGRKFVVDPGTSVSLILERLALPQSDDYLMAQIPIGASEIESYIVEARRFAGYDQGPFMGEGVLIHKVHWPPCVGLNYFASEIMLNPDTSMIWWRPGETFVDSVNQVTIRVEAATATGYALTIDHLPDLVHKLYLPLLQSFGPLEPQPTLCVTSAWTADGNWNPTTSFAPGEAIVYDGLVLNPTPNPLIANVSWSASGPCGPILSASASIGVGAGTSSQPYGASIPLDACAGLYTYILDVSYAGASSSESTTFTVTPP